MSGPLYKYLHRRWLNPWRSPVEFGAFLAKTIRITDLMPSNGINGISNSHLIELHRDLCAQIANLTAVETLHPKSDVLLYDGEQADSYHLTPTFRALILKIDSIEFETEESDSSSPFPTINPLTSKVRLIRTGDDWSLNRKIDFASIIDAHDCMDSDTISVTTSLEGAVDFVLKLQQHESIGKNTPSHDKRFSPSTLPEINQYARSQGYTGPTLQFPSTTWVTVNPLMGMIGYHCA